jgi:hypothetical protein
LWKQQHSLQGILAPENFKSYQELEARFNTVTANRSGNDYSETIEESSSEPIASTDAEGDNTLEYFKKLAEQ